MSRFLFNDASLHGQFASGTQLFEAFGLIFRIRNEVQRSGFRLEVNRRITERPAITGQTLRQVIGKAGNPENKRRILSWLDKDGPFWDDPPIHSGSEYFECDGEVVTDTALAEACNLMALSTESAVVSLTPSKFSQNLIEILWRGRVDGDRSWQILNFFSEPLLVRYLNGIAKPPASWSQVLDWTKVNCPTLLLSPDILSQLPTTFFSSAAQRALVLFKALDEINSALQQGKTGKFDELRRLWMQGDKARMTDSSDGEKDDFATEMNFKHPVTRRVVACTWHAKIKTPQFRIHFEWPKQNEQDALFIGYFGPKLTKR
jgi:hypothetical protein